MNKIHHIYSNISVLFKQINTLWDTHNHDLVYISFGGKYNESHITFNYPENISQLKYVTNASYQLIPQFIRDRDTEHKILVIAVDNFSDLSTFEKNVTIINNVISRDENRIDVVLFDRECSHDDISGIVEFMAGQMVNREIKEAYCMISNYIKYRHPNLLEQEFEERVPEIIQRVLNQPPFHRYSACFYNWFGNSVYTYNIVYNYKKYLLYSYYSHVFPILDRNMSGLHLSCMNMAAIHSALTQPNVSSNQKTHFDNFLQNSVDITTFCTSYESIAEPMNKYYIY
jgi:hypothetical protein